MNTNFFQTNNRKQYLFSNVSLFLAIFLSLFLPTLPILNTNFLFLIIPIALITIFFMMNLKLLTVKKYFFTYIFMFIFKYAFLIYQAITQKVPMGGYDWVSYNSYAKSILRSSNSILEILANNSKDFFSRLVALSYYFTDNQMVIVYLYVFICSLILFSYIIKLSTILFNDSNKAQLCGLLYTIWPLEFVFSITFLRELPIQLFFIMSLYYYLSYFKNKNYVYLLFAFMLIFLSSMMHSGMIVVAFLYAFFMFYNIYKKEVKLISIQVVVIFLGTLLFLRVSPLWNTLLLKFNTLGSVDDLVARTQVVAGNTSYIIGNTNSIVGVVLQIPYRVFMFMFSPLPWQINNLQTAIALMLSSIPQWYILFKLYIYFIKVKAKSIYEKNIKKLFFLILFLTYAVFALGTQNYGTAMRHRMKVFPLELVLIVSVVNLGKRRKDDVVLEHIADENEKIE